MLLFVHFYCNFNLWRRLLQWNNLQLFIYLFSPAISIEEVSLHELKYAVFCGANYLNVLTAQESHRDVLKLNSG